MMPALGGVDGWRVGAADDVRGSNGPSPFRPDMAGHDRHNESRDDDARQADAADLSSHGAL